MPLNQITGSRCQVMHGSAKKTTGGLTKSQLKYNKQGKIVSKKASELAKKNNRLVKAGYVTRKGQFGVKMKGGALLRGTNNMVLVQRPGGNKIESFRVGTTIEEVKKEIDRYNPEYKHSIFKSGTENMLPDTAILEKHSNYYYLASRHYLWKREDGKLYYDNMTDLDKSFNINDIEDDVLRFILFSRGTIIPDDGNLLDILNNNNTISDELLDYCSSTEHKEYHKHDRAWTEKQNKRSLKSILHGKRLTTFKYINNNKHSTDFYIKTTHAILDDILKTFPGQTINRIIDDGPNLALFKTRCKDHKDVKGPFDVKGRLI
jgi:hypothetical protein